MKKKNDEFSFKDLMQIFIPKIWLIALVAVLLGAVLGVYSAFIKKDTYTSTSMIMVTKNTGGSVTTSDRYLAADMVEPYEIVIMSDTFLGMVIEKLEANEDYSSYAKGMTPSVLSSMITVEKLGETELFRLNVTSGDPRLSYAIAYVLEDQITDAEKGLSSMLTYSDVSTKTIDEPALNTVANSKNIVRNTLIGVVGGAVLTMIVLFIASMFDVVIRDRKKLDDNFDIPVLGVIPRFEIDEEVQI
ncbi:MAG: hypothetical protein IKA64_04020 [Clostridia bacterium]|nr:hypothetical protein [Clostridia bacterium]